MRASTCLHYRADRRCCQVSGRTRHAPVTAGGPAVSGDGRPPRRGARDPRRRARRRARRSRAGRRATRGRRRPPRAARPAAGSRDAGRAPRRRGPPGGSRGGGPPCALGRPSSAGSSGMAAMCPNLASTAAADFAPQPGMPGKPSAASPTSASQSGIEAGGTPNLAVTPASSSTMSRRRSQQTTRSPTTACARSLSGEQSTTWSTPGRSRKRAAAVARASSASNSTIGHTTTPSARDRLLGELELRQQIRVDAGAGLVAGVQVVAERLDRRGRRRRRRGSPRAWRAAATGCAAGRLSRRPHAPRRPASKARRSGCGTARRCRRRGGPSSRLGPRSRGARAEPAGSALPGPRRVDLTVPRRRGRHQLTQQRRGSLGHLVHGALERLAVGS